MKAVITTKASRLEKLLKKSEKDIKKGDNLSPASIEMEKMDRYLANL